MRKLKMLFLTALAAGAVAPSVIAAPGATFVSLAPCRVADTRLQIAGALAQGEVRAFDVLGLATNFSAQGGSNTGCGIPSVGNGVVSVAFNFVAVEPASTTAGFLRAWAGDAAQPVPSILNYNKLTPTLNVANGVIVPVRTSGVNGDDLNVQASRQVHVIIDIAGYFVSLTSVDGAASGLDADTVDGITGANFVRSDVSDTVAGTLTFSALNPIDLADGAQIDVAGSPANLIFGGANLEVQIGDSGADRLVVLGEVEIGTNSATDNDTMYFDDGVTEFFQWQDANSRFEISDDLHATGDFLVGGGDIAGPNDGGLRITFDQDGDLTAGDVFSISQCIVERMRLVSGDDAAALFDGAVTANGLDFAEAFKIHDKTLAAGDVVRMIPSSPEFIRRTRVAYDAQAIGVISANPGFQTGGSFSDEEAADPVVAAKRYAARLIGNHELAEQYTQQLSAKMKDKHRAVALAGRVPVKVVGPVKAGDHLTSSSVPGHAMAMDRAGRSIGIAIESSTGNGQGKILAFIQPGWYGGANAASATAAGAEQLFTKGAQIVLNTAGRLENAAFSVFGKGRADTANELLRIDERGDLQVRGAINVRGGQLVQYLPVSDRVEAGDVLIVDRGFPGAFRKGDVEADIGVVGIVSGDAKMIAAADDLAGENDLRAGSAWELSLVGVLDRAPVALSGTVLCKVDASHGAIRVGDLLTVSTTPGHAMRSPDAAPGTILAKALEPLKNGRGKIRVLVMMR